MEQYFSLISQELLNKLEQVRHFITKHNPTIGLLTEAILREFLVTHLPKSVAVEQGFLMADDGSVSKQCDILVYDCLNFAPYYRINDVVVIPARSVIAIIEVKTTLNKSLFPGIISYFENIQQFCPCETRTYLFIYNAPPTDRLGSLFNTYKHPGEYQSFDHDTFYYLPDEITGLDLAYHFKKSLIAFDRDCMGYDSYFYQDQLGKPVSAVQIFLTSLYEVVQEHNKNLLPKKAPHLQLSKTTKLQFIRAIELFNA